MRPLLDLGPRFGAVQRSYDVALYSVTLTVRSRVSWP